MRRKDRADVVRLQPFFTTDILSNRGLQVLYDYLQYQLKKEKYDLEKGYGDRKIRKYLGIMGANSDTL